MQLSNPVSDLIHAQYGQRLPYPADRNSDYVEDKAVESCVSFIFMSYSFRKTYFFNFFNTLFGNLNHLGQNVLHLVPQQKREKKKEGNYYK